MQTRTPCLLHPGISNPLQIENKLLDNFFFSSSIVMISTSSFLSPNHFFREACKNSTDNGHESADNNQHPVHRLLSARYLFSKQLQVERQREDDTNAEAGDTAEKGHDAIERRENDCDDNEYKDGDNA